MKSTSSSVETYNEMNDATMLITAICTKTGMTSRWKKSWRWRCVMYEAWRSDARVRRSMKRTATIQPAIRKCSSLRRYDDMTALLDENLINGQHETSALKP